MADDYTTDKGLEEGGWAAGWDAWDVIKDVYGDAVGDDELAGGQLESLKRAILAGPEAEPALGRHEDERGVIEDLLGRIDAVTAIFSRAGAVRGNHCHKLTTQWTYVVSGAMTFAWLEDDGVHTQDHFPDEVITERAGVYHAWKAITGCRVLVFTRGPRSGEAYESDVVRLAEKDWLLR